MKKTTIIIFCIGLLGVLPAMQGGPISQQLQKKDSTATNGTFHSYYTQPRARFGEKPYLLDTTLAEPKYKRSVSRLKKMFSALGTLNGYSLVTDWSDKVKPQKGNTCAFNSIHNAQLIAQARYEGKEPDLKKLASFEKLPAWQDHVNAKINLDSEQLRRIAIEKAGLKETEFTIIDSFEQFVDNPSSWGDNDSLLAVLKKIQSSTPNPKNIHIFFLGTMNQDNFNALGHWVTCVVSRSKYGYLQLDYADSIRPSIDDYKASMLKIKDDLFEDIKSQNQTETDDQIKQMVEDHIEKKIDAYTQAEEKKIKTLQENFTAKLKTFIQNTSPLTFSTPVISGSLESALSCVDANRSTNALPHLRNAIHHILCIDPAFDQVEETITHAHSQKLSFIITSLFNISVQSERLPEIMSIINQQPNRATIKDISAALNRVNFGLQAVSSESDYSTSRSPSPLLASPPASVDEDHSKDTCPKNFSEPKKDTRSRWKRFWDWVTCKPNYLQENDAKTRMKNYLQEKRERERKETAVKQKAPFFIGFLTAVLKVFTGIFSK